jgi:hypothetical protein
MIGSKPKITYPKGSVVVCLESHAGPEDTIRAGDRLRSDHPAVLRNPQLFHVEGLTTSEIHALHQERFLRVDDEKGKS